MTSSLIRRPLPAIIALVALLLLTALVWWRVLNRATPDTADAQPCPSPTATRPSLPAPSLITASVYNSTTRNGIAAGARQQLVDRGFNVPKPAANASKKTKITVSAEIRYGPKGKDAATLMRYYFPGSTLRAEKYTNADIVVVLGTKFSRVATSSTVRAALTRNKIDLNTVASGSATPSVSATCGASGS